MHAVILDIDGTLLHSTQADGDLYRAALTQVLGPVRLREDWGRYRHVTDSGILEEVLADNGVPRSDAVLAAVEQAFIDALERHIALHGPFAALPGARAFVRALHASRGHAVAYATGAWARAALAKLASAGFPLAGVPLKSADDAVDRRDIMRRALGALHGAFTRVTYYGDGPWDRDAAQALGWQFVAVGRRLGGIARFPAPPRGAARG